MASSWLTTISQAAASQLAPGSSQRSQMLPRGDPIVPVAVTLSAGVDPATGGFPPLTSLPQAARHQSKQEAAFRPPLALVDCDSPPRVDTEAAGVFRPANPSFPYQQAPKASQPEHGNDHEPRPAAMDHRSRRQQIANHGFSPTNSGSERGALLQHNPNRPLRSPGHSIDSSPTSTVSSHSTSALTSPESDGGPPSDQYVATVREWELSHIREWERIPGRTSFAK